MNFAESLELSPIRIVFGYEYKKKTFLPQFTIAGQNAMVATDAICYMSWIAAQYGLEAPDQFKNLPDSCSQSTGDKTDIDKLDCGSEDCKEIFDIKYFLFQELQEEQNVISVGAVLTDAEFIVKRVQLSMSTLARMIR